MGFRDLFFRTILISSMAFLLFPGCGSKSGSQENNDSLNAERAWESSFKLNLGCSSSKGADSCSTSVVEIHVDKGAFKSRCSGLLLQNGQVLTASHCLSPSHLKDRSCGDSIKLRNINGSELSCLNVNTMVDLTGIERGALTADWALLEVQSPLQLISEFKMKYDYLPSAEEKYDIYWYKDSGKTRILTKSTCASLAYNPFTGKPQQQGQSGWFVGPCDVVPGASGGPVVISGTKDVVGVLSQSADDQSWAYLSFAQF